MALTAGVFCCYLDFYPVVLLRLSVLFITLAASHMKIIIPYGMRHRKYVRLCYVRLG
jgi:hypothetical protein